MSKKNTTTPLDQIEQAEFPLIPANWKGTPVLVKVRELSQVQIYSCGQFSLIDLEKTQSAFTWKRWVEFSKQKYEILKASMVSPSYKEVFDLVGRGPMIEQAEKDFREIAAIIESLPRGPKRQRLEEYRDSLLCRFRFVLPEDFIASIVGYALSEHKSDIKKVTREMLLTAAILAENGHDNPADHLDGMFTPFNRDDINLRAAEILREERKTVKRAKNGH